MLFELDCLEVIIALGDEESRRFLPVLEEVKWWLLKDWLMDVRAIPRGANMVADHMTRWGARQGHEVLLVLEDPPQDMVHVLLRQVLG